jgi:hypothetical protein
VRSGRRISKLGIGAACSVCGENDRWVLERHHVANRVNDPDTTVAVCRNRHASLTEELRDLGVPTRATETTPLDRLHCWPRRSVPLGTVALRSGNVVGP